VRRRPPRRPAPSALSQSDLLPPAGILEEIAAGIPQEVFGQTDKTARLVRRSLPSNAHRTQCTPKRGESLCRH
jgi:hypothetical protein